MADPVRVHQGQALDYNAEESEEQHKAKLGTERKAFTASAIGGEKKLPKTTMPKQADYPDMSSYAAALRKWRAQDEDDARTGRAAAVKGKLGASASQ